MSYNNYKLNTDVTYLYQMHPNKKNVLLIIMRNLIKY